MEKRRAAPSKIDGLAVMGVALLLVIILVGYNKKNAHLNTPATMTSVKIATARSVVQGQPTFGTEGWYHELLNKRFKICNHTSPFFHYFLPHRQCENKKRFGKCNDGAKWICLDKFEGRNTRRAAAEGKKCVIYSFGSSDDSCFETAMADNFDCGTLIKNTCSCLVMDAKTMSFCIGIHIFDPTSLELKDPRWTYHSYGLGGADPTVTSYWNWRTQRPANCTDCPMKNLKDIMKELGHSWVDILKVDIDGAEWRSFEYIYNEMKTLPADQFQVELTGLDITNLPDSLAGGFDGVFSFWSHVLNDGFKIFEMEPNYGTCDYRSKERAVSIEYAMWRGE